MDIQSINGAISKGNQPKFIKADRFYKVDAMGYESISEVLVSEFLRYCEDVEYIDYFLEQVEYRGEVVDCCKSKIYTKEGESFISLYRLLNSFSEFDEAIKKYKGMDFVNYVVDRVKEITSLDIRDYLRKMMLIDAIILNEDRHLNNILFLEKNGEYSLGPIFDNGLSLLSDVKDYPLHKKHVDFTRMVKSRPFSTSFKKQVRYFPNKPLVIDFDGFIQKLEEIQSKIDDYIPFKKEEYNRAKKVLLQQLERTEGELWLRK